MSKRATYTTIVHDTLRKSGLSVQEFFIADVIDKLSNPVCFMLRSEMESLCVVSKRGLIYILNRLIEAGYVEKSSRGLKSTQKWKDMVNVDSAKFAPTQNEVQKVHLPSAKSAPEKVQKVHHSIYINDNNKDNETSVQEERPGKISDLLGKTPGVRLATIYGFLWIDKFGTLYKPNYGAFTKAIVPLLNDLSEWQVAALMVMHFNWYGTTGEDEHAHRNLESNGFPIYWIPTKQNDYIAYLINALEIKWDDNEAVREWVKEYIKGGYAEYKKRGLIKEPNVTA